MTDTDSPFVLHGDRSSGNCWKPAIMLSHTGRNWRWAPMDVLSGRTRSRAFLALNPNGKMPLLQWPDGRLLAESNAILFYLGSGSEYWPTDKLAQTRVLEWQCFEQYTHEPTIAVARFIKFYQGIPDNRRKEYESKLKGGYRALDLMERYLAGRTFLVGEHCSIADISLYAYTHVAHEGGFDLSGYSAINRWMERIEALPGYIGMQDQS